MSVVFFMLFAGNAAAQKRFSKSYPAGGESVRLELVNKSGTVTVIGWNRPEINITATLEAPGRRRRTPEPERKDRDQSGKG